MSQTIKIKRSSIPGKVPLVADLDLGELAVNTYDGKLYTKKNDGFEAIVELSGGTGGSYTAGSGIDITGNVISSTVKSAGNVIAVQIGDGAGNFGFVPQQPAGRVLTSNGTMPPTWEPVPVSGGTVRSVDINGDTTGLTFTGGPIDELTPEGVFVVGGTLAVAHGGTGGTTVAEAQSNLLPSQAGFPGAALYTDGAGTLTWQVPPGSNYTAGVGLQLTGNEFSSTVADNTGEVSRVTVSNGDGTLRNLPAGVAGRVLTSAGAGVDPTWENISGTVSNVTIYNNPTVGLVISGGDPLVPPVANTTEITETGTISLSGTLSIQNGGTGAGDASGARTNLLPSQVGHTNLEFLTTNGTDVSWAKPLPDQTSNAGKFLTTNGTVASWDVPGGGGTVLSVDASGGDTGMTFTGGPVTTTGTLTLDGTLNIASGGTGATTAAEAINALVPAQTGQGGKVLTTNGTSVSWTTTAAGSVTSVDIDGTGTGLSFNGGPITSSGAFTIGGVLNIATGGTGASDAQGARNNILPTQTGNAGRILGTNGTDVSWVTSSGGSVTSVSGSGGTTGLTLSGGPITSSGTLTLGGTLSIANGGTGATSAVDAINALVPSQTGNTGKVLSTNGTVVGWSTASAGSVTSVDGSGGTTGLTLSGGPITSSGTLTLGGTLAIANGGTGATSAQQARNNLLPVQTSHAGQALVTNGTDVFWSSTTGTGTVTSVDVSGGTTGLTTSGGPVTSAGTITLGGTLAIANGGTGATSASSAINALLPTQTSNSGKVLSTNGTAASWVDASTLGNNAAGSTTQIQYNNAGALAGSPSLTFTSGTSTLAVPSLTTTTTVDLSGSVFSTAIVVPGSAPNFAQGTYFSKTVSSALTWDFTTNVPASGKAFIFALALTNGGSGVQTWPASVVWPGGTAPTLTSGASAVDILIFSTTNGGTTWRGSSILNYAS